MVVVESQDKLSISSVLVNYQVYWSTTECLLVDSHECLSISQDRCSTTRLVDNLEGQILVTMLLVPVIMHLKYVISFHDSKLYVSVIWSRVIIGR